MIEGYFDPAGRPYVRAYVVIPGLQPAPETIRLLLDTGADNTFIQPAGARTLGIRTQDLSPTGTSRGIGGTTGYAAVPGFIAFQERPWPWRKTRLVYFQTELAVAVPDRANINLPSLLGRDVIDRCRLLFSVNYFCRLATTIFAGSPPYPGPVAELPRCGSWGHRIPG